MSAENITERDQKHSVLPHITGEEVQTSLRLSPIRETILTWQSQNLTNTLSLGKMFHLSITRFTTPAKHSLSQLLITLPGYGSSQEGVILSNMMPMRH